MPTELEERIEKARLKCSAARDQRRDEIARRILDGAEVPGDADPALAREALQLAKVRAREQRWDSFRGKAKALLDEGSRELRRRADAVDGARQVVVDRADAFVEAIRKAEEADGRYRTVRRDVRSVAAVAGVKLPQDLAAPGEDGEREARETLAEIRRRAFTARREAGPKAKPSALGSKLRRALSEGDPDQAERKLRQVAERASSEAISALLGSDTAIELARQQAEAG